MYTSGKRAVSRYLCPYRVRCILFVIVSYRINLRIIRAALIAVAAPGPECHEAWACAELDGVCSVCFRLIIGQILPDRTIRKAKAHVHVLGGQATRPSETIAPDTADRQSLAPGAKNRAKEKKNMASPEPVRLLEKPAYAYGKQQ
jgi:hypothetical protein